MGSLERAWDLELGALGGLGSPYIDILAATYRKAGPQGPQYLGKVVGLGARYYRRPSGSCLGSL